MSLWFLSSFFVVVIILCSQQFTWCLSTKINLNCTEYQQQQKNMLRCYIVPFAFYTLCSLLYIFPFSDGRYFWTFWNCNETYTQKKYWAIYKDVSTLISYVCYRKIPMIFSRSGWLRSVEIKKMFIMWIFHCLVCWRPHINTCNIYKIKWDE